MGRLVLPSLVNSRMAGRVPTQRGSWESPGVESGEERVLLRSDAVRSTWAQMIAVASAGGTGGREGRGANVGRGTGGVPYQTPWHLPEPHLPEANVCTKYLMSG